MNCWVCGEQLTVRRHARGRNPGQNTVDANIRTCDQCWEKIKRRDFTRINIASHIAALNRC